MLFSSLVFLVVFLPCVLAVYYLPLRKHRSAQNIFLLLASLFFYAWGEPWFVLVMISSIVANWIFGLIVDRVRNNKVKTRLCIIAMLIFNLAIIFVFKYLMFTLGIVNTLFNASLPIPDIALPIGISFFTFQAISYVIDVYRGKGEVQKNLLNVGLYISFFPQLIAGPIVRYQTIADQIRNRTESREKFEAGVSRFIVGLCKKILIANNCALVANHAFYQIPAGNGSLALSWLGAIAYTLQIYYDFSGYSDMAIGLGKMFGFEFLENFNYPYISGSVSEFWRRWHISLGSWFRDYVYFPLGGSRVRSRTRLIFNLFVVWFLTGLWHGANWTFICWGLMYFVLISIEKIASLNKKSKDIEKSNTLDYIGGDSFAVDISKSEPDKDKKPELSGNEGGFPVDIPEYKPNKDKTMALSEGDGSISMDILKSEPDKDKTMALSEGDSSISTDMLKSVPDKDKTMALSREDGSLGEKEKLSEKSRHENDSKHGKLTIKALLAHIYTMLFVVLGWVLFRSNDLASGMAYIEAMFGINSLRPPVDWNFTMYLKDYAFYLGAGVIFSLPVIPYVKRRAYQLYEQPPLKGEGDRKAVEGLGPARGGAPKGRRGLLNALSVILLTVGFILCLAFLMKGVYNPFIYFNF